MNSGRDDGAGAQHRVAVISAGAAVADTLGGVMAAIPNFNVGASGFGGSPHVAVTTGGVSVLARPGAGRQGAHPGAGIVDKTAGMVSTVAGYQRRFEDWQMQASTSAARRSTSTAVQIAGARIRLDNATPRAGQSRPAGRELEGRR